MDIALFVATTVAAQLYFSSRARDDRASLDDDDDDNDALMESLEKGTSLNASERICLVTPSNEPIMTGNGVRRAEMRLKNLWHRATYVLIRHEPEHLEQHGSDPSDVFVLVQKRSHRKDYCPGRLDPTPGGVVGFGESYVENAVREMKEEMGIDIMAASTASGQSLRHSLKRLFTFRYENERVRVWGQFFEYTYRGKLSDLKLQEEEVESVDRMSLLEMKDRLEQSPQDFMPDACYAMRLYFQRKADIKVNRRLLKGFSSSDLDAYGLRPKPEAIFYDCDDCLYFDGWKVANMLTAKIDEWCVNHGLKPGQAYQLYKQYGTALRGLQAEGYLEETAEAVDRFLADVHDIPIHTLIQRDDKLRSIILSMDPTIPRYIFTASVGDHARRCIRALGIEDLFVDIIDCKKCNLETKHSRHSFEMAMKIAGVKDPEKCLFFDDNLKNIRAARQIGWRSVLVGRVGRDHGNPVTSEHAELEIDVIHHMAQVLPELFDGSAQSHTE